MADCKVSIHAPTRGATSQSETHLEVFEFQSTHPHGVRPMRTTIQTMRIRFQSTHPHGVRLNPDQQHRNTRICFNPRTHTGCDTQGCTNAMPPFLFQSTHPHGVRRPKTWSIITYNSFNPRTHTGCDHGAELPSPAYEVSIHAPTRGATLPNDVMLEFSKFQSTHPHGVRLRTYHLRQAEREFQSTHPHGVRR